jgi:surface protein
MSRVYDISGIFQNANIKSLNSFLQNLTDTSRVIDMSYSFADMTGIPTDTILDLSNFDTSNVKDMNHMFNKATVKSLILSSFDNRNVENMSYMFYSNKYLTELDLSNFTTPKVKDMSYMFSYCDKIKTLDLSNFDISNVITTNNMFSYCYELESLDISSWKDENLENIGQMFFDCRKLKEIDLSNFELKECSNVSSVFGNCQSIEKIKFPTSMNIRSSTFTMFNTSTNQLVDIDMSGNTNFSFATGSASFDLSKIWRGNTEEYIQRFVNFVNSLGNCSVNKTRTFKIYTDLYNALSSEQKALITNKGYTLSYGS